MFSFLTESAFYSPQLTSRISARHAHRRDRRRVFALKRSRLRGNTIWERTIPFSSSSFPESTFPGQSRKEKNCAAFYSAPTRPEIRRSSFDGVYCPPSSSAFMYETVNFRKKIMKGSKKKKKIKVEFTETRTQADAAPQRHMQCGADIICSPEYPPQFALSFLSLHETAPHRCRG